MIARKAGAVLAVLAIPLALTLFVWLTLFLAGKVQ